ncbi:DUF6402 family protein [Pseudomonas chlororaphis]|uniref:DUF6402 family protein n=1 Tax=Pseudomonas chlororaphis TaxID=587753 RepID=UPI00209AAC0A|nr:DUF6402 family protein [Pseudomonas chlororaphis]MCO7574157.1 DUF6402 family protein [Pseudomonas chlororaphis]MCO7591801.1 DUF6402 family protein [Pseudomonas chlororaphis]
MSDPAPITAQLTASADMKCAETTVEDFQITDIPAVMRTLGWVEAARIMQRWFDGEVFVMSPEEKRGRLAVDRITQEKLFVDLDFDWLSSASSHTGVLVDELLGKLSSASQYNEIFGRKRGGVEQLTKGLLQFMQRMQNLNILDVEGQDLIAGFHDYSQLNAIGLETTTQTNFREISTGRLDKALNPLDDVYGALGGFTLKIAITKFSTLPKTKGSAALLKIHEVGCYVRDTYEFLNADEDQLLGYWNSQGVVKPDPIEYLAEPEYVVRGSVRYFKVTNDSFNCYRAQHRLGGDLFVYSSVKKVPVSILIYLSDADFGEFLHRTQRA